MKYLLTILTIFLSTIIHGQTLVSDTNGNWETPSNWNLNRVPVDNDTIIIDVGDTVTIISNNNPVYDSVVVIVYGRLFIESGKKLRLECNGRVIVQPGGSLGGTNGGSKLEIGRTTGFRGSDPDYGGYAECNCSGCTGFPLPIELLYFSVRNVNNEAFIEWETASETDVSHFIIERSTELNNWENIYVIPGSNSPSYYYYTDTPHILTYYRLKEVDINGNDHYYEIDYFSPNPISESSDLIKVIDVMGRESDIESSGLKIMIYEDRVIKIHKP